MKNHKKTNQYLNQGELPLIDGEVLFKLPQVLIQVIEAPKKTLHESRLNKNPVPKEVKDKKLGNIELFENRVIRARSLTKKFLFNLPHGVYVMSNCFEGFDTPIFFRQITPDSDLDAFWQEILDVKANHRAVWVFPNLDSAKEWIKRLSGR